MAQENPRRTANLPHHLEEKIRQRAYEIYEARGREEGHDLEHWLIAEEEITKTNIRTVAA